MKGLVREGESLFRAAHGTGTGHGLKPELQGRFPGVQSGSGPSSPTPGCRHSGSDGTRDTKSNGRQVRDGGMEGWMDKRNSLGLSETGARSGAHVCVPARDSGGNGSSQAGRAPYSPADSVQPLQLDALLLVRGHAVPQLEDAVREAPVSVGTGGSGCQQPGQVPCQHRGER